MTAVSSTSFSCLLLFPLRNTFCFDYTGLSLSSTSSTSLLFCPCVTFCDDQYKHTGWWLFVVIKIVFVTHIFFCVWISVIQQCPWFLWVELFFLSCFFLFFCCLLFWRRVCCCIGNVVPNSAHNFVCPDTFVTPPPAPWWFLNGKGIQVQNASTSNAVSARYTQKQWAPLHHLNSTGACVVISAPVCFWGFLCPGCLRPQSTSRSKESTKRARCQLHTGSRRIFGQNRPNG